jgi:CRISPR-associated endonuclease Csy4
MDHYVDLRIRPDPEFPVSQLMGILFTRLHLALAAMKSADIGISFPDVIQLDLAAGTDRQKQTLGPRLRLHAEASRLRTVLQHINRNDLQDYLQVGNILPVPEQAQHCRVSRVIPKSSPERLLRRQMRRHPDEYRSPEDARQAAIQRLVKERGMDLKAASEQVGRIRKCELPFISLKSQSTGQPFRLFIRHGPPVSRPQAGSFNSYGLSTSATIPWFRTLFLDGEKIH